MKNYYALLLFVVVACGNAPAETVDASVSLDAHPSDSAAPVPDAMLDAATPDWAITCGDEVCDGLSQICLGCATADVVGVRCVERLSDSFAQEIMLQPAEHGCNLFNNLFIECDSPGDCPSGSVCVFLNGEAGTGQCIEAGVWEEGVACESSADCSINAPVCDAYDPFGYFANYGAHLGWAPRACQAQ